MWNDGEGLPIIAKKILIYFLSIILTIIIFYLTYKYILPKAQDPTNSDNIANYIGTLAIILTIVGYMLNVTNDIISRQVETSLVLSLEVTTDKNFAIITSTIENKSINRIRNMKFFLFIDQPVLENNNGLYKANHVLKHDCANKYNCQFSKICKDRSISGYPSEFKLRNPRGLYYSYKKLDFLSPEGVLYVNPGERFSEDVVFSLKPGVYRVLLIGLYGKKLKKCSCANKQFIIRN